MLIHRVLLYGVVCRCYNYTFLIFGRPDDGDLASISSRHPLTSYDEGELKDEFLKLTGYKVEQVLPMAKLDVSMANIRLALHVCVLHANSLPPKGQSLSAPKEERAAKGKSSRGKRVSFKFWTCLLVRIVKYRVSCFALLGSWDPVCIVMVINSSLGKGSILGEILGAASDGYTCMCFLLLLGSLFG